MEVIVGYKKEIEIDDNFIYLKKVEVTKQSEVKAIPPVEVLTPLELQDKLASMLVNPIEDDSVHLPKAPVKYKRVELPDNLNNDLGYTCQDCGSQKLSIAIIHANGSKLFYCKRHG